MLSRPTHRHWTTWIAACAILLAALAPAVTQWLRTSQPSVAQWAEICSTTGATKQPTAPTPDKHASGHCAFCLIHADTLEPPTGPALIAPIEVGVALLPTLFLQAPRTPYAWAPSQARAPPTHS